MRKEVRIWAFDPKIFELARFQIMLKAKLSGVEEIKMILVNSVDKLKERLGKWPGEPRGQPVDLVVTDNSLEAPTKKVEAKKFWEILSDDELLDHQKGEKLLSLMEGVLKKRSRR